MSREQEPLRRLERLIREEFDLLLSGNFKRLGEVLCEKTALVQGLQGLDLDPQRLRRCRRLNRELLQGLASPVSRSLYQR